mgnify:CR=1 FL=1
MDMKKITFLLYIIAMVVLGVLGSYIGTYLYKVKSLGSMETPILEGMEYKNLQEELALIANNEEEKVSPNATLVLKTVYKKCGHEICEAKQIEGEYVNMSESEFGKIFSEKNENFVIEKFSPKEIIAVKELNYICNEHYLLKENKGLIVVYKYNTDGEKEQYKETNIGVDFLTDIDKSELKKGIEVVGENELNSKLEDYI